MRAESSRERVGTGADLPGGQIRCSGLLLRRVGEIVLYSGGGGHAFLVRAWMVP